MVAASAILQAASKTDRSDSDALEGGQVNTKGRVHDVHHELVCCLSRLPLRMLRKLGRHLA
jgi:hypothetical protein